MRMERTDRARVVREKQLALTEIDGELQLFILRCNHEFTIKTVCYTAIRQVVGYNATQTYRTLRHQWLQC